MHVLTVESLSQFVFSCPLNPKGFIVLCEFVCGSGSLRSGQGLISWSRQKHQDVPEQKATSWKMSGFSFAMQTVAGNKKNKKNIYSILTFIITSVFGS